MTTFDDHSREIIEEICQERIKIFIRALEHQLVFKGVPESEIQSAVGHAQAELERQATGLTDRVLARAENRRIDSLGRLLVEFCFLRSPDVQMLWPEHSAQDIHARREFVKDIVPRPLMRYFLVSVRGTLNPLDDFYCPSLLVEPGDEYQNIQTQLDDRLDSFKGPFGSGESQIDWESVYEDTAFQTMTLGIIKTMRHRLNECGLETYLSHLQHYRGLDPESRGINAMHRPLSLDDARQLEQALEFAEGVLWQITQ